MDYLKPITDLKWGCDFAGLSESSWWSDHFRAAMSTGLWITVAAVAGNSSWAWGLSYAFVTIAFSSNVNALCNFCSFVAGKSSFSEFMFMFLAQAVGAASAFHLAAAFNVEGINYASSGAFTDAWSENWCSNFWFSKEVIGIFFFKLFWGKINISGADMPESFKAIFLIAIAFMMGGANFAFFPGHLFAGGFSAFANASTWVMFFQQMWAVVFGTLFANYVW